MDDARSICLGCGRTLDEIGRWGLFSEERRRAVMEELGARLERLAAALNEEERRCRE